MYHLGGCPAFPPYLFHPLLPFLYLAKRGNNLPLRRGRGLNDFPPRCLLLSSCIYVIVSSSCQFKIHRSLHYALPNVLGINKDFYERLDVFVISLEHDTWKNISFSFIISISSVLLTILLRSVG